jgi:outer membrane protein OmpA-like peptidoglycan-associated protein
MGKKLIFILLLILLLPSQSISADREFFYVYSSKYPKENHYSPSGIMGDTGDIGLSRGDIPTPSGGKACLRIAYKPKGAREWAGIYWQNPPNNWGEVEGGYDLGDADKLTFWAKGEKGRERIALFKIGGITGRYNDSDSAFIGPVKLSRKWKQYTISLKGKDVHYISGGFCFTVRRVDNPRGCTFYLDEIRYEGKEIKGAEIAIDRTPPVVSMYIPVSSFSPDGDGVNDLISFEMSAKDNIAINSWRLEISTLDGKSVRTFQGDGTPPSKLAWNGVDDYYHRLSPSGEYATVFSASDRAGNWGMTKTQKIELKLIPQLKEVKVIEEERGLVVRLTSKVLFDFDKFELKEIARSSLDEVVNLLKAYPENKVNVEGHTDSVGTADYNLKLSQLRAASVAKYLIRKGVQTSRIKTAGYGEAKAIASNVTIQGRQQNRRVEIVILK